jgi:hypothetical protein
LLALPAGLPGFLAGVECVDVGTPAPLVVDVLR